MRGAAALLTVLLLGWLSGCTERTPTQVLVYFDAEPMARARAERLRVVVVDQEGERHVREIDVAGPDREAELPVRVPLVPRDGDASRRFEIEGVLHDAAGAFAWVGASSGYVEDRLTEIRLLFEDDCVDIDCPPAETCFGGACTAWCVEPSPPGEMTASEPHACDAEDAGAPMDAGRDAAPTDAAVDASRDAGPRDAGDAWWDTDWAWRVRITPLVAELDGALDGFVVMVALNPTRIDYGAAAAGGADLRFVAMDGTTLLPHEVAHWEVDGLSIVWVRLPRISLDGSTHFWMYYGNASAGDGEDEAAVWSDWAAVYHFEEDPASGPEPRLLDHGPGGRHLATSGSFTTDSLVDGAVGDAWAMSRASDQYAFEDADSDGTWETGDGVDPALQAGTGDYTFCLWFRASVAGSDDALGPKVAGGVPGFGISYPDGRLHCVLNDGTASVEAVDPLVTTDETWTWRHVCCISDRDGLLRLLVDGRLVDVDSGSVPGDVSNDRPFTINGRDKHTSSGKEIDGAFDELRFNHASYSDAWVEAEYLSQTDALLDFGDPESRD